MSAIFSFGEKVPEYDMKVLNEREVRASAGILFLFAMIAFLNSWLIGDFSITKIFVVVFLVDFSIRVLINPKYSPTLIIARFFVRNQTVEYVGAPQKRVAWLIGLVLAIIMFYLIVLNNLIGPFNLLVCVICLTLLFFEAAFGICLGCKLYNLFNKEKAKLCPGNACAINDKQPIQKIKTIQAILVVLFLGLIFGVASSPLIKVQHGNVLAAGSDAIEKDCSAPDWAIKMGHEEKWKLHNGCKDTVVEKPEVQPKAQTVSEGFDVKDDCVAPDWAIKIGHEEKWKTHNGCTSPEPKKAEATTPVQPIKDQVKTEVEASIPATENSSLQEASQECVVPNWAIEMGHQEMWKQHNCQ